VTAPVSGRPRLAVPIVAVVLGALVLCGSAGTAMWRGLSNSFGGDKVRVDSGSLPAVCGLVPAELLARLAPGATASDVDHNFSSGLQVSKECQARTGFTGDTTAQLRVEVTRYGSFLDYPPAEHAKHDFINAKKIAPQLSMGPPRDVAGVGDSAFVTVDPEPIGDFQRAEIQVLRGTEIVEVSYWADPSTPDLVASAALTVARAVLEKLS
jgi:hypothetical protein